MHMKVAHRAVVYDASTAHSEHICQMCKLALPSDAALKRHVRRMHTPTVTSCHICDATFGRSDTLARHMATVHDTRLTRTHACHMCREMFESHVALTDHFDSAHPPTDEFTLHEHALNRVAASYAMPLENATTLDVVNTRAIRKKVRELIRQQLVLHDGLKVSLVLQGEFHIINMDGDVIRAAHIPLRSIAFQCVRDPADDIVEKVIAAFDQCTERVEELSAQASGWILKRIRSIFVEFIAFKSFTGAGWCDATQDAPLPCRRKKKSHHLFAQQSVSVKDIRGYRYLVNIDNASAKSADTCLLYAIAAFFLLSTVPSWKRTQSKMYDAFIKENIVTYGVSFPSALKDIYRLVDINPLLCMTVNVFVQLNHGVFPLALNIGKGRNVVNLLLIRTKNERELTQGTGHYLLVRNIQNFLRMRYSTTGRAGAKKVSWKNGSYCLKCFTHFTSKQVLHTHMSVCRNKSSQCELLPPPDGTQFISFKNHKKTARLPIVVFFDFESILEKDESEPNAKKRRKAKSSCQACGAFRRCKCDTTSYTSRVNVHKCVMYAYIVVDSEGMVLRERVQYCTKVNAAEAFIDELLRLEPWFNSLLDEETPMVTTAEDRRHFMAAKKCYVCDKPFLMHDMKHRDHDHYTGAYRGSVHAACNMSLDRGKFIPLICHNLSGYDSHFILQCMKTRSQVKHTSFLAKNTQKFLSFTVNRFRFIDSLAFLSASLSSLGEQLRSSKCKYDILKQSSLVRNEAGMIDEAKLSLLQRKGVFPYEHADSHRTMTSTTKLPPQKAFYSELTQEHISDDEYAFARSVWSEFECKDLKQYMKLYNLTGTSPYI